jgi:hypothetical protein
MKPGKGGGRVLRLTLYLFHLTSLLKIRNLPGLVWLHSPPSVSHPNPHFMANGQWKEEALCISVTVTSDGKGDSTQGVE